VTSSEVRDRIFQRPPAELDPYKIPATLAQAFKDFQNAHQQETLRLCSHNLLLVCQGVEHSQHLARDLDQLLQCYPGRVVVVVLDPEHQGEVAGYLSVFTRKHVLAGELIGLHFGPNGAPLPSLVAPLWRDGLPVVTFWRGRPPYGESWFLNLVENSTRLVVDSQQDQAAGLQDLVTPLIPLWDLIRDPYLAGQAFTDFTWGRLSTWRDWIASLFDRPDRRRLLRQIDAVEIESWALPGHTVPGLSALYLASWLMNQLSWKEFSPLQPVPGGYEAEVQGFPLRFYTRSSDESSVLGRPVRVTFRGHCGQEPFRLSVERDSTNSSTLVLGGTGPCFPPSGGSSDHESPSAGHRLHVVPMQASSLMGQELEMDGRDLVFERVLETLLRLTGVLNLEARSKV